MVRSRCSAVIGTDHSVARCAPEVSVETCLVIMSIESVLISVEYV